MGGFGRRREMALAKQAKGPVSAVALGPLDDSVGYLVRRAQVTIFQHFFERFAVAGVRPAQYSVLTVIQHNPGLSQNRLAEALGIKKTNLVAMIDELERRGLARRMAAERDRRSHALFLTQKGSALMARLHRLDAALNRHLVQAAGKGNHRPLCDALRRIAAL
jgi:DNA-binding MarR family transcriptional regulator